MTSYFNLHDGELRTCLISFMQPSKSVLMLSTCTRSSKWTSGQRKPCQSG